MKNSFMNVILLLSCAGLWKPTSAFSSVERDLAFEKIAYRLELIRNQIELTIDNHGSVTSDLRRQEAEMTGLNVFLRVPMADHDLKNEKELLESIRRDFAEVGSERGFRVAKISFAEPWRSSPKRIPNAIGFDQALQSPDETIADKRNLKLTLEFKEALPDHPDQWMKTHQDQVRRLFSTGAPPTWSKKGKTVEGIVTIYRYREFEYPKMLAPDLSMYLLPGTPVTSVQKTAAARAARYRQEIQNLWPRAQPYIDNMRKFALNDLRMTFFLKHAGMR